MTDTSLTPPVNAYDPTTEDFKQQVHDRIRADLQSIGKVYLIEGTIIAMQRFGVQLKDVVACVEHPRLQLPLKMSVQWDEDTGHLIYHDEAGMEFTPLTRSGYDGGDNQDKRDQEIIQTVFSRMDADPATHDFDGKSGPSGRFMDYGTLFGGGAAMALTDAITATPEFVGPLGCILMATSGATMVLELRPRARRRMREINKAVDRWNEDLSATLSAACKSGREESAFFDALYASAEKHGVTELNRIEADRRSRVEAGVPSMNNVYHTGRLPAHVKKDPFRRPMIHVNGNSRMGYQKALWWDGVHFYMLTWIDHRLIFSVLGLDTETSRQERDEAAAAIGYLFD